MHIFYRGLNVVLGQHLIDSDIRRCGEPKPKRPTLPVQECPLRTDHHHCWPVAYSGIHIGHDR